MALLFFGQHFLFLLLYLLLLFHLFLFLLLFLFQLDGFLWLFEFGNFLNEIGVVCKDIGHIPGELIDLLRLFILLLLLFFVDLYGLTVEVLSPFTGLE
jgi:hypothetical protein